MTPIGNPLEALSLDELRTRTSWKWTTYPNDVLPLWVAEMDVPLAPPIAESLYRAIANGDTGYVSGTELVEAFQGFASRRWGWDTVSADRTLVVVDVMNGFVQLLDAITEPGDPVIVNPPVYTPFYSYTEHHGRRIVEAPLGEDCRIDLEALDRAFAAARASSPRAVYLLANPHNPTGVVHTVAELTSVLELAATHGVTVVSNEIHAPIVYSDAQFTPLLSLPGAERAFSLTSASKAWNLAGAKAAVLVGGSDTADDLAAIPAWTSRIASHLGVIAQTAAYNEGDEWLDALLSGLERNRNLLGELLTEHLPEVGYLRPQGTYMAWLDCRNVITSDRDEGATAGSFGAMAGAAKLFYDDGKVAVTSGHVFGPGGTGRVRINFGTSSSILTTALRQMGDAARSAALS
ncbi:aminotransferase class I/II-fold pyridoxal phosphate-dependent enzyme [Nocardioides sp. YIM 152315]|uniref:MalY/PatB family protein n=1 Tax=Nocardioides sp. YIM 152315 TaxID=3031760 RepID=UPI0023DC91D5|nr:aminotransferase class I/II-fold pyridoxal phosphate-dependent enzyme [Nocardioides sp. YIM 152315]MDF1605838.1 aminotransferase class I/II-fold pyridoxal phosphate-dependent enzyme [Nocardioides sp. YIM 152315]